MSEANDLADRLLLQELMRRQPAWYPRQFAQVIGRSVSWAKEWCRRLQPALDNPAACYRRPPCRTPQSPYSQLVIERILDLRDHPPENLNRVPGARTILYYLHRDPTLAGERLPTSPKTVWRILRQHGRIGNGRTRERTPVPRPEPMAEWQLDFKDAATVPADPDGKQQHVVEILNTIDVGTSILVDSQVRSDFTAATVIAAVARLLQAHGLPKRLQIDRDPRFIGGAHYRDLPSPLVQLCLCLGVAVTINPPHRPDLNGFVERYHRSLKYECLLVHRPTSLGEVTEINAAFQPWYNEERPHQGITCGNQPPKVAHPNLPALPGPPLLIDPDGWLAWLSGATYPRQIRENGTVAFGGRIYYVSRALAGQEITVQVDPAERLLLVYHQATICKRLPIKGLVGKLLSFDDFVAHLIQQARWLERCGVPGLQRHTALQRATPLKQRTPLTRRTPLKQTTPLRRHTPLRRSKRLRHQAISRAVRPQRAGASAAPPARSPEDTAPP